MASQTAHAKLDSGSMGDLIATFTSNLNKADNIGQNNMLARNLQILELGNFNFTAEMGILGIEDTLKMAMSPPKAIAAPLGGLLIKKAAFELNMFVESQIKSKSSVDSKTDVHSGAKGGGLFYKAHIDIHATLGTHNENQRDTDSRSSCKVFIEMEQAPPPEGMQRLTDALYLFVDKGMEVNLQLIEVQKEQVKAKANEIAAANKGSIPPTKTGSADSLDTYDDYSNFDDAVGDDGFGDDDYADDDYADDGSSDS